MKILIIHYSFLGGERNTISEHLYSFRKYSKEDVYYLDARFGIPTFLQKIKFDIILYHYTFLALKWDRDIFLKKIKKQYKILKYLHGEKAAIPQDEYLNSDILCDFFKEFQIKTIFTCLMDTEWEKVYPKKKSGVENYVTVLTGYIDENIIPEISKSNKNHSNRKYDLGYRARRLPYWLGSLSLRKWLLTEKFNDIEMKYKLKLNLSNNPNDVFYGDNWYKFLSDCRVVLGCESGASLLDRDGSIRLAVEKYVGKNPYASFEEVESACFKDLDNNLSLHVVSPRHFEAAITKTCQALIEGDYNNIFIPDRHYIVIKKDWSNLPAVLKKISDINYCEQIAENAFKDIVDSKKYTYENFVNLIIASFKNKLKFNTVVKSENDEKYLKKIRRFEKYPFLFSPIKYIFDLLLEFVYQITLKIGVYENLKKIFLFFSK